MDKDAQCVTTLTTGCADFLPTSAQSQGNMDSLFDITASKRVDGVTSLLSSELKGRDGTTVHCKEFCSLAQRHVSQLPRLCMFKHFIKHKCSYLKLFGSLVVNKLAWRRLQNILGCSFLLMMFIHFICYYSFSEPCGAWQKNYVCIDHQKSLSVNSANKSASVIIAT